MQPRLHVSARPRRLGSVVVSLAALALVAAALLARAVLVAEGAPAGPTLGKPAAGARLNDATPSFSWSRVAGVARFRFELATDPTFDPDTLVLARETTRRSLTPKQPLPPGAYVWRVGAVSSADVIAWSESRAFTIAADAGEPAAAAATATRTPLRATVATRTPTPRPRTATATPRPTRTPTPEPTRTPTPTRTPLVVQIATTAPTETATPTATPTATSTATPTPTATGTPTATASATPSPTATATATVTATSTATSTPSPTSTVTPTATGTATASPTGTNTPTATATATLTPTPTATAKPASGGLVRNGSFESDGDYWYVEGGARFESGDGLAHGGGKALLLEATDGSYADQRLTLHPGNTYVLTAWGKLDGQTDLGYVGIGYRDALGQRLADQEPPMLEFTDPAYTQKSLTFTVPASAATVTLFAWKPPGAVSFVVDDLTMVQQVGPAPTPSVTPVTAGCQRLIAPAYFYPPTGLWTPLIGQGSAVSIVVLNVNSGPDVYHDASYDAPLADARAAGMRIAGYIATGYGTRPVDEVTAEMDRYREWYGVTSFFLDEVDWQVESLETYRAMATYAHQMGGIAILNFGYPPNPGYLDVGDILVVFEGGRSLFATYELPRWMADYPADRFGVIVYQVPANTVDETLAKADASNVGYVWVTDEPYGETSSDHTLPSYWSILNQKLDAGCR